MALNGFFSFHAIMHLMNHLTN